MYAGRKRRKAVQKAVKQPSGDGTKSNPSKRHRDRLNTELDRLARLLPFPDDVTSNLDKLSILRLSVSFLCTKHHFFVTLKDHIGKKLPPHNGKHNSKSLRLEDRQLEEGELLLQALNGFVLVVTSEGIIFYASHTIQDYLGFHQTDVLHQCVFELVHTEDRQAVKHNLHWAENTQDTASLQSSSSVTYKPNQVPPEDSSFLERSFICRFRCLLDNSSGFLALSLQGHLKFLHGQKREVDDGGQATPQLALFAVATPLQSPSILEIRTKNMIFRTKHELDFTPMACDAKGKIVLGYTEAELCVRGSGYQFIHAADMLYCAENHVRMIKTGESGLTVFRLLTKENQWKWVQANARLIYRNGKPDYIIATQRPLGKEEGGEHLRKRSTHLPFTFTTGEALLYQTSFPVPGFYDNIVAKGKSGKAKKTKVDKGSKDEPDPSSLLGAMMNQDESVYICQASSEPKVPYCSSQFNIQEEISTLSTSVENENWNPALNRVPKSKEPTSFDPLLATLDSLSLENEENCSNSELFSALENLGLNAEDLELLLLDERMIQVDMDPEYVPSLNDLLTNNEILSYIQNSLENWTSNRDSPVHFTTPDLVDPIEGPSKLSYPNCRSDSTVTAVSNSYLPPSSPLLQLSKQMQQHLNSQSLHQKGHSWIPETQVTEVTVPQHSSVLFNAMSDFQNGHWIPQQTLEELSQVSVMFPRSKEHQQPWHQNQLQPHFSYKHQLLFGGDSQNEIYPNLQWQGANYVDQPATTSCYANYALATGPGVEFSCASPGEFQSDMPTPSSSSSSSSSYQQFNRKQPPTNYSYTNQNASLNPILPSLDVYEMFDSTQSHESTHRKMEDRFILKSPMTYADPADHSVSDNSHPPLSDFQILHPLASTSNGPIRTHPG